MDINYIKNRIGSKFYTYIGETRKEIRVIGIEDDKILTIVLSPKEEDVIGLSKYISLDDMEKYIEVIPDAKLDIMITSYIDETKKDIYAWVYRTDDIINGIKEPRLMLRQDMISYSKNAFNNTPIQYVGECLTDQTNPVHVPLMKLADFYKVDKNFTISLYLSDTLNDITLCIDSEFMHDVNAILHDLTKYNGNEIKGYCDNLIQLFTDNRFIGFYRSLFNITQLDFEINPEKDDNDVLKLTNEQQHNIEDLLHKYITNVIVLEYDQDIDIKEIVQYKHIIVSDAKEKIYLITFDIVDDYPVDDDIAKAFGLQSSTKEEIEEELGIKL